MIGWGVAPWGIGGWGVSAPGELLQLVHAEAMRENVVLLTFNMPVYFSLLLDPQDASAKARYSIAAVQGSVDDAGKPTRPVLPAQAIIDPQSNNTRIAIATDRPFSSYPSRYLVSVNHIRANDMTPLEPGSTSQQFDGTQFDTLSSGAGAVVQGGDFANPQTNDALGLTPEQAKLLGGYPVSPAGDYAFDRGVTSYKKRIIRRLLSAKFGFAYLSTNFGLGAVQKVKKVLRPSDASKLAADAEAQVRSDPETAAVSVSIVRVPNRPEVLYLKIAARHISGVTVNESVPLAG